MRIPTTRDGIGNKPSRSRISVGDNPCISRFASLQTANITKLSLLLNIILIMLGILNFVGYGQRRGYYHKENTPGSDHVAGSPNAAALIGFNGQWHGGYPLDDQPGSCWCSSPKQNGYCLCTPALAIDLVVVSDTDHVWSVRRKDTNLLATIGGYVKMGETVEDAVRRELQEETGITIDTKDMIFFGLYSDPRRDTRRHTVSAAYAIHLDGTEQPVAADDVKDVQRILWDEIEQHHFFADHKTILLDYRRILRNGESLTTADFTSSDWDFAPDIVRSICVAHG